MSALRIVVIGAGHMGSLHAHKLHALAREGLEVELAGVVDVVGERAEALAQTLGVVGAEDYDELLTKADAVIVAVPTVEHYRVVMDALKAGLHVLVEKPIAASLPEAEALLATARSEGRRLQVGHLERFNTALRRVADSIREPRFIEAHRLGPFPGRSTDVDVVRDLMIHDLDIILRLVGAEPERIEAVGVPVISEKLDIANARLTFPTGCVANVTASRVSPTPLRKIRIFQPDGYLSIDFLDHRAAIFRADSAAAEPAALPGPDGSTLVGVPGAEASIRMEPLELDREDALAEQLRDFVEAVRTGSEDAVAAEQALSALRTALRITDAMPSFEIGGAS